MINIFLMLGSFILLWIVSMVIHEIGHVLGAKLTGGNARIEFWNWYDIPSMRVTPFGNYDDEVFKIAGGAFAFFVYIIPIVIPNLPIYLYYPLFTIAIIQGIYGIYEWNFLGKIKMDNYMKWHYVLYFVVWLFLTISFYISGKFV